jgi:hypothetical protein
LRIRSLPVSDRTEGFDPPTTIVPLAATTPLAVIAAAVVAPVTPRVLETVTADRADVPEDTVKPAPDVMPDVVRRLPVIFVGLPISKVVAVLIAVELVIVTGLAPEVLTMNPEEDVLIDPADPALREVRYPLRVTVPVTARVDVRLTAPILTAPVELFMEIPVPSEAADAFNSEVEDPSLIVR